MNDNEFHAVLGRIGRTSRTVKREYLEIREHTSGENRPELNLTFEGAMEGQPEIPDTFELHNNSMGMVASRPVYRNPLLKFSPVKSILEITSPKSLFKRSKKVPKKQRTVDVEKLEQRLAAFEGLLTKSSMSKIIQAAHHVVPGRAANRHPLQSLLQIKSNDALRRPTKDVDASSASSQTDFPPFQPTSVTAKNLMQMSNGTPFRDHLQINERTWPPLSFPNQVPDLLTPKNNTPFLFQRSPSTERRVRFHEPDERDGSFNFNQMSETEQSSDTAEENFILTYEE